jgi:uncharacterized protein HemX
VNPVLLKLLPWALILVMALGLWGAYEYAQVLKDNAQQAVDRAEGLVAQKAAMEEEARKSAAILVERETTLVAANRRIAAQHKALEGLRHEGCLNLDARYDFLSVVLLPGSSPVQPTDR